MKKELELTERQQKLLEFIKDKHSTQKRKYTNEPYFIHLVSVATIVSEYIKKQFVVEIALCHDVVEDFEYTKCTEDDLLNALLSIGYNEYESDFITLHVKELTDVYTKENYPNLNRKERKEKEVQRLSKITPLSQSIKYADIIDNTSSIVEHDRGFAQVYLREILDILDKMREGDINLYILCCNSYKTSIEMLTSENILNDVLSYYELKIREIDAKYTLTQDNDVNRIDYKKKSNKDANMKSLIEDFLADINFIKSKLGNLIQKS